MLPCFTMNVSDTKKQRAWLLPDAAKNGIKPGLYLVATPIGNLRDISLRALDVLAGVDRVVCEDTRVSGKLLAHYGIRQSLSAYNDHTSPSRRAGIVKALAGGQSAALISDAGTPLLCDPGYKLVRDCRAAGIDVTAVPGANALLGALQLSGQPGDKFSFLGFLPPKRAARLALIKKWGATSGSVIAFETAPRLAATLEDIGSLYPVRPVCVARELTKIYEEVRTGTAAELLEFYRANGLPKGELVLVLAPPEEEIFEEKTIRTLLSAALKNMGTKEAASHVAKGTGLSRKELYSIALDIRREKD